MSDFAQSAHQQNVCDLFAVLSVGWLVAVCVCVCVCLCVCVCVCVYCSDLLELHVDDREGAGGSHSGLEAASFLSVSGHCVLIDGAVRLAQGSSQ